MREKFSSSTDALNYLKRLRIRVENTTISVSGQLGLKGWAAVDYLCNYHKHTWIRV